MSQRIVVYLSISSDEYLRYYQGNARTVLAHTVDGITVRFPAGVLQKVVTREGVHGRFAIHFNAQGKFERIERLA